MSRYRIYHYDPNTEVAEYVGSSDNVDSVTRVLRDASDDSYVLDTQTNHKLTADMYRTGLRFGSQSRNKKPTTSSGSSGTCKPGQNPGRDHCTAEKSLSLSLGISHKGTLELNYGNDKSL